MDDSFQLRAQQRLDGHRTAAPLAHDVLSAALAARQSASPAATAQARAEEAGPRDADPLIALLLAEASWKAAASRQRGCFNRAESKRGRNRA